MKYSLNVTENKAGEVFYDGKDLSYEEVIEQINTHLGYARTEATAMLSDAHISGRMSRTPTKFYDLYSPKGVFVTATVGLSAD